VTLTYAVEPGCDTAPDTATPPAAPAQAVAATPRFTG